MNPSLQKELRGLMARVIKIPADKIGDTADFYKDLKVDSLLAVEILAVIDQKYGIDVPENKLRGIRNLKQLTAVVEDLLKKKKTA